MHAAIKNIFLILLMFSSMYCNSQTATVEKTPLELEHLISKFVSSDWREVYKSKNSLLNIGKPIIPHLIKLMDDPKAFSKLENSANLVYPGAIKSRGHGWLIHYDLDWIAIRAGWVLEILTSQNFGFSEIIITDKQVLELHKNNYAKYIENNKNSFNFRSEVFKAFDVVIKRSKDWWKENEDDWTALNELKQAIFSDDVDMQWDAIQQMRYPKFRIKGFTQAWFDKELRARIIELGKSDDEELKLEIDYLLKRKI